MTAALAVHRLTKNFGGVEALSGVDLAVATGERRAVIGPNGAGKTTLFHAIAGALFPSAGSIFLLGHDITRMAVHRRVRLGLARTFQITNLFPRLTVLENLLLALRGSDPASIAPLRQIVASNTMMGKAAGLLEQWGLAGAEARIVRELSYGEQRQVELILALAGAPRVLLLDEPTAGLAPAETARVVAMVGSLPRDITILMIEHDMDVAFALADRITVLHQGRVVAEGDPAAIRANPQVAEIYLGVD
jgi:branched-chain amino acid transport system ATP-binding protein